MKTRWLMLAALPILALGCAHLDYVGQSYPPKRIRALFVKYKAPAAQP